MSVEISGEITICQVTFSTLPPTSDIAAAVVRNALEQLVKKGDREILAMALDASGDALPDTHYGGALVYKPGDRQIRPLDEQAGLQAVEVAEGSYFVRVEDSRTAEGITPERSWCSVSIVFHDEPSARKVKAAVLKEIDKLKSRGLDVNLYIYTGNKSNKITWKQLTAASGKFMAIDYVAATGEVSPNWDWGSSPAPADEPKRESRTWADATGKFSVVARLVKASPSAVELVREDGSTVTVPRDRLSEADLKYLRSLAPDGNRPRQARRPDAAKTHLLNATFA